MKVTTGLLIQLIVTIIFSILSFWYIAIVSAFLISFFISDKRKIVSLYISITSLIGVFLLIISDGFIARLANSSLFARISGIPGGNYLLFILLAIEVVATTFLSSIVGSSFV